MVFNSIINWNDAGGAAETKPAAATTPASR
jgi:hypothetical protein